MKKKRILKSWLLNALDEIPSRLYLIVVYPYHKSGVWPAKNYLKNRLIFLLGAFLNLTTPAGQRNRKRLYPLKFLNWNPWPMNERNDFQIWLRLKSSVSNFRPERQVIFGRFKTSTSSLRLQWTCHWVSSRRWQKATYWAGSLFSLLGMTERKSKSSVLWKEDTPPDSGSQASTAPADGLLATNQTWVGWSSRDYEGSRHVFTAQNWK